VVVGEGVRILHSIILDGAEVKDHACIIYSIIGWQSIIGRWTRLEGVPDFDRAPVDDRSCGITILGKK
jgi:mannose-1-phosphate guanylyltransferase